MDPKLLLVKIVTLLFKESELHDPSVRSTDLVKMALNTIKLPESSGDFDRGRETIQAIRATILWMAENPSDYVYDRAALLQRIRVNVSDDESLYLAIEAGITPEEQSDYLKKQCILLRGELRNHIDSQAVKDLVKQFYQKAYFSLDGFDVRSMARDIMEKFEQYASTAEGQRVEGMLAEINLKDLAGSAHLMKSAQEEMSSAGIMKMGWQGMNRMMGDHDGLRRGECVVVGALQHNYKTGFTLSIFKQLAMYNTPYMKDPTKKPCLVHISTENELKMNVLWLYRNIKENETGQPVSLGEVDHAEAAAYVHEKLTATGYEIIMTRWDPSETSFQSHYDFISQLEADGYEVHAVVSDYLNMYNKRGCVQGAMGFEVRDLWRRMRNFHAPRGILFMSPHQLSPGAKALVRQNVEDFVKEIEGKGYYDSCSTIDQEVDLEIFIHIVKVGGESFLTIQRGKHRKITATRERDRYIVLPFQPVADIPDDFGKKEITMRQAGNGGLGFGDVNSNW
jgi:hypothetical protein